MSLFLKRLLDMIMRFVEWALFGSRDVDQPKQEKDYGKKTQ